MKFKEILLCVLLIYSPTLASLGAGASAASSNQTSAPSDPGQTTDQAATEANHSSSLISSSSGGGTKEKDAGVESSKATLDGDPESMATSPTMTSVHHQVWTSSSSGSLDELSPEIISKLRGDVPFLAAYALRPRLVGAASSSAEVSSPVATSHQSTGGEEGMAANLQTSASQQQTRRHQQSGNLPLVAGPNLSDFSELKVETSSTSKSEHHHNRKTTLKKQQPASAADDSSSSSSSKKRRQILAATSKLMIERRRRKNSGKKLISSSSTRKSSSNQRSKNGQILKATNSKSGRLRSQANKLRRNLNRNNRRHHMSIIRHGRQRAAAISPALNELPASKTANPSDDGGVKGGRHSKSELEPFYKRRKTVEPALRIMPTGEPASATNDLDGDDDSTTADLPAKAAVDEKAVSSNEENEEDQAQLEPPEPRRVGDPDVDEVEGDTVTVMPKFDGVDDDPEIPIEESEAPPAGGGNDGDDDDDMTRERESSAGESQDEPRSKRVNRDRSETGGGDATVAGGGIGATIGGSGQGDVGRAADSDGGREKPVRTGSGVEFADDNAHKSPDDDDKSTETSSARRGQSADEGADRGRDDASDVGERPFDSRRVASDANEGDRRAGSGRKRDEDHDSGGGSRGSGRREEGDDDDNGDSRDRDVDYRDAIESNRSSGVAGGSGEKDPKDGHPEEADGKKSDGHRSKNDDGNHREHGHGDERPDCDEHGGHHDHHHHHHDGIKWLQDAIPGEPGRDYPILSRINLTNFNCRDHKHAGYYADVEARCQVFHICQADGRQDSFLCPNGTIFSQISRVCVWWNSFDCEDAPKFYALNAQLYNSNNKQATSQNSAPDLRPLDGARIIPSDGTVGAVEADDDGVDGGKSSIDSLIKAMRRRQMMMSSTDGRTPLEGPNTARDEDDGENGGADGGGGDATAKGVMMNQPRRAGAGSGLSDEDEASIQRKSTKLAAADEQEEDGDEKAASVSNGASSRLRRNGPRRKRRASVRQSPPKLKSRRVSRNSRRRKLRHGIKPKRRA